MSLWPLFRDSLPTVQWSPDRGLSPQIALPKTCCSAHICGKMRAPLEEYAVTIIIGTNELRAKLEELRTEHRDLDAAIQSMSQTSPFNQLQIQRLKKRKLVLKDAITKLESHLVPDIIA